MKKLIFLTLAVLILAISACTASEAGLPPAAALKAQTWLSEQLGVSVESLVIREFKQVEWSDSCLELGGPADSCLAEATPGWLVIIEVDGESIEVHTDSNAEVIRMKEA